MVERIKDGCFSAGVGMGGCCRVDSLVTVDERGQMVLPKDVRQRAGIKAGDKLALITWGDDDGESCCLFLIKTERLTGMVKGMLGPLMKDFLGGKRS